MRMTTKLVMLLVALLPLVGACAVLPSPDPCANLRVGGPCSDYDDIDAKKMFGKVTDALVARDTKALKSLFSRQALSEAPNFDAEANALVALFQGKVESLELNTGADSSEYNGYDGHTKELTALFDVNTSEGRYRFFMVYEVIDSANPSNVGLYTLQALHGHDEESLSPGHYWDKKPGISSESR